MKVPRLLTLMLSLSLFGTTGVYASSMWGEFEGYVKAKVLINNAERPFKDGETPAFF